MEEITITKLENAQNSSEQNPKPGDTKVIPFNFVMVTLIDRGSVDLSKKISLEYEIDLLDPQGKSLKKSTIDVEIPSGKKRMRINANIQGMPITIPGDYHFRIGLKNSSEKLFQEVASIPLELKGEF